MVRRYWIYQKQIVVVKITMGYCKSIYSCTTCVRQTNSYKQKKRKKKTFLGKDTVYIFLNSVMQHLPGEKKHNLNPELPK